MAILKFIINIFKKLGKLLGKLSGKKEQDTGDRQPGERRIGIYGPSAVGKSVFFTMLYKACRQDREFNLTPFDPETGKQLITNLNTLRSGEWLPGTVEESELNFKASLRGGSQFPFSTKDYKGETVDLEQDSSAKEQLISYFQNCDAILFLLSPEMIADPRKCEREITSFQAMINQVTESGGKGLRIPVGLMITKADTMNGFENDSQVVLISRKAEYLKAKSFGEFVDGMCGQYHVAHNIVFQESVRELLGKLSLFFDFLMTLDMEFQVFFTSSVGHVRTETDAAGEARTYPPEDPEGIGVKIPFLWVIETIRRRERIAAFNSARRLLFRFALVLLAFYSIFYAIHLLPHRDSMRQMQDEGWNEGAISGKLHGQADRWVVRNFGFFALPGAKAWNISDSSRRLAARYDAHLYLKNDVDPMEGVESLGLLSSGFDTEEWRRSQDWFDLLRGPQQGMVSSAVWQKIEAHNLRLAVAVRELELEYGTRAEAAPGEIVDRCAILGEGFLPVRGDLAGEYNRLVEHAESVCDRISRSGVEKILLTRWDAIKRELDDLCQFGSPPAADIQALRDEARALEKEARANSSSDVRELAGWADLLDGQLRLMQASLDPANADQAPSYLRKISQESSGELQDLASWARRSMSAQNESERSGRESEIAVEVQQALENANWAWFTSGRTERKISNFTWLRGKRQEALRRYQSALEEMRQGVALELSVQSVPPGFVVVSWDPRSQAWDISQAIVGQPILAWWIPGQKMRVGLQRAGAASGNPCSLESFIWELHGNNEVVPCPGTGGNVSTEIRFDGLAELVNSRLATPLAEAFPE